jgi:KEOPS complex subunit Pcc1
VHTADYVLTYDSPEHACIVERSVGVEMGDIGGDRTRARVDREGATVTVTVTADDLTALRAGTTTWLTLVEVAEAAADVPTGTRS